MEVITMQIELDSVERAYLLGILEECKADILFRAAEKFGSIGISVIETVIKKLEN